LRLTVGDAAGEILHYAEETKADLIVMGAKARRSLAGHLPGTTAYKVVSKAHCPVLTVRTQAERVKERAREAAPLLKNIRPGWART
jgi:nucleotide-binding universal stress UspA family protein